MALRNRPPFVVHAQHDALHLAVQRDGDGPVPRAVVDRIAEQVGQRLRDARPIPGSAQGARRLEAQVPGGVRRGDLVFAAGTQLRANTSHSVMMRSA